MKTKLEQLTIAQFIDLLCGDAKVLLGSVEVVTPEKLSTVIRDITLEYKSIVDSSSVRSFLATREDFVKARISVMIFTICQQLLTLNQTDNVRSVLAEVGIKVKSMSDSRLEAEVKSHLGRAKSTMSKILKDETDKMSDNVDIRKKFDELTATLMAYFKFQIDTSTMKASIYAHLVARHARELKTQLAAMKRK